MTEEERREKIKKEIEDGLEALGKKIEEIQQERKKALDTIRETTELLKAAIAEIDEMEEGNNGDSKET